MGCGLGMTGGGARGQLHPLAKTVVDWGGKSARELGDKGSKRAGIIGLLTLLC